jgi:hypothetical protein
MFILYAYAWNRGIHWMCNILLALRASLVPKTAQIQYQWPPVQLSQASLCQLHPMQLQMEPQFSYQMSAALPSVCLPSFGNQLDARRAHDWPNVGAQPTVIDSSAGL